MRRIGSIVGLVGLAIAVPLTLSASVSSNELRARALRAELSSAYVSGEILVRFRQNALSHTRAQALAGFGDLLQRDLGDTGFSLVKLAEGRTVAEALIGYRSLGFVESVQPNYRYRYLAVPNDPAYGQLWGLRNAAQSITGATYVSGRVAGADMDMENAWDVRSDCSTVTVAVLDSGVNYTHQDLAANMWDGSAAGYPNHGYDVADNDNDPMPADSSGHGTHVAGTIAAVGNNSLGATGVCWSARVMAVRVSDASGPTTSQILQAMSFAIANGARVMNMSFGGPGFDSAFQNAVMNARNSGVILVVSAGNEGTNNDAAPVYPCSFPQDNVICVAALDQAYSRASFSNYGAVSVDVGAPGANIMSTWPGVTTADNFSNWTRTGGWAVTSACSGSTPLLVNPALWCFNAAYANNANDMAYKTFDLTGVPPSINATASFAALHELSANDFLSFARVAGSGNPFDPGGTVLWQRTGTALIEVNQDVTSCVGVTCTLGFRLTSDASAVHFGIGITPLQINTTQANSNVYQLLNGTSMAAPHVTGLAALTWAQNANYTYTDVVAAVRLGGERISALDGVTSTGRAVNANGSLRYIAPPSGISAIVTLLP